LTDLSAEFSRQTQLIFVRGNHDRDLEILLQRYRLPIRCVTEFAIENYVFLHGDLANSEAQELLATIHRQSSKVIMGHEHPAITLGSGPANFAKCPCFLISREVIILPAFSQFAAGVEIRRHPFMSPLAKAVAFTEALAVLGNKVGRISLET
jgi:metallophosphoesterase superfamily enzyme